MATTTPNKLSATFAAFFNSEKAAGVVILVATIISLTIANSSFGAGYIGLWHFTVSGLSIEHWINDGLMAIFFLLIGLELRRELYNGELSDRRNALLPVIAALGGVVVPAAIHFSFNAGSETQAGMGIPMATDIAFALGVLALLGSRVPASLKIFLTALAVIDDLAAIIVIALFYTTQLSVVYLLAALVVLVMLLVLNLVLRVTALSPYLLGGALLWFLMLRSGIHATIAGVLLAFAIPSSIRQDDAKSPSHKLEHALHRPVAFLILPVFALANTAIAISADWRAAFTTSNSLGIMIGLFVGKPLGITLLSFIAVSLGICRLPAELRWRHLFGAGILGGIGFTMSIFITNLAFPDQEALIDMSKIAILSASLLSGITGFLWLSALDKQRSSTR